MKYCSQCGDQVSLCIPNGDDRQRFVCSGCGCIHYENPKMVVGCIPEWEERILLCRRSIEPKYGKWTLPAGYLENGESVAEGAKREAMEEACAAVEILSPYALYSLTSLDQVYLIFRARLLDTRYRPGEESLAVRLFSEKEIPWDELAFLVIRKTLEQYFKDRPGGIFPTRSSTISLSG